MRKRDHVKQQVKGVYENFHSDHKTEQQTAGEDPPDARSLDLQMMQTMESTGASSSGGDGGTPANDDGTKSPGGSAAVGRRLGVAGDADDPTDHHIIEICSCWNLPAGDLKSSDPYVKVKIGGEDTHRTAHIPNTLNPIFTVKHGNLFTVPKKDVLEAGSVLFKVKEYDLLAFRGETLGWVEIDSEKLANAKGERMEFKLERKEGEDVGHIVIRCNTATNYDLRFVQEIEKGKDSNVLAQFDSSMCKLLATRGGKGPMKLVKRKHKKEKERTAGGVVEVKKYRTRPYPDPERAVETKWMSKEEIESEAMKPSRSWLDIGSGTLGKVFLEIIGIDDLFNTDSAPGGVGGFKTDGFVSVIYEDCIAKTDIIDDCLHPRWMPWTQRAFILRSMHPNSQLFLGVFDHDTSTEHDMIGRVSVDLANLYPGTQYVLHFNVCKTAKLPERESRGVLIIRLRIECDDERQNILKNLEPPPNLYVNVRDVSDFKIARRTIKGKYDVDQYSTKTLTAYVDELRSYKYMTHYLEDAAVTTFFWRGHYPLKITKSFTIHLPLHSLNLFLAGVLLAERPTLFPSFCMFGIALILLAVMFYRRKSPNPWGRCKTFLEILQMLISGACLTPPPEILPNQNEKEARAFKEKWEARIKEAEESAAKRNEEVLKQQEEYEKKMQEIGDMNDENTDLSTEEKSRLPGVSIAPLKMFLYPIQIYLGIACDWIRFIRNVVIWEECYISFLVALGSSLLGIVFLFVPWTFFLRWGFRLIVWVCFGPWMKLVDLYWYSKEGPSEEDKEELRESRLKSRIQNAESVAREARIKREQGQKKKDLKSYLYGSYITKVPVRNMDRYHDIPLHPSSATPESMVPRERSFDMQVDRVGGQFVDDSKMVPRVQNPVKLSLKPTEFKHKISKRKTMSIVFFALALPALVAAYWYVGPCVSGHLPSVSLPSVHLSFQNGVHEVKTRLIGNATKETITEEFTSATCAKEESTKKLSPLGFFKNLFGKKSREKVDEVASGVEEEKKEKKSKEKLAEVVKEEKREKKSSLFK